MVMRWSYVERGVEMGWGVGHNGSNVQLECLPACAPDDALTACSAVLLSGYSGGQRTIYNFKELGGNMDFLGRDGNIFWPVLLVMIGSVLLMVQMGVVSAEILAYWPVLLVVVGLMGLSNISKTGRLSRRRKK